MTGTAKLVYTAILFAAALGLLTVAAATYSAVPLFFIWLPLLGVPWVLARPDPGAASVSVGPTPATTQDGGHAPPTMD